MLDTLTIVFSPQMIHSLGGVDMYGYDDDDIGFIIILCFLGLAIACFAVVAIALSQSGL